MKLENKQNRTARSFTSTKEVMFPPCFSSIKKLLINYYKIIWTASLGRRNAYILEE